MGKLVDLTGKQFGNWTVIQRDENSQKRNIYWVCRCKCGTIRSVAGTSLRGGISTSCGCEKDKKTSERTKKLTKDLSGQSFGEWTVLYQDMDEKNQTAKKGARWICRCSCGTVKSVLGYALKDGRSKSCGHKRKENSIETLRQGIFESRKRDLVGEKFGELTVIEKDLTKSGQGIHWKCRCSCGNICSVRAYPLLHGKVKSCGCYNQRIASKRKFNDLTNKRIGRLKVIGIDHKFIDTYGNSSYYWRCICDCGNTITVSSSVLTRGDTKSCGCLRAESSALRAKDRIIDITGKRFGLLTVIRRVNLESDFSGGKWECLCDCGCSKLVDGYYLRIGAVSSCGCLNQSKYELYVSQYLESIGMNAPQDFQTQIRFPDLRGADNGMLSYDFGLYRNGILYLLIECQGQQHYKPVDYFGGEEQYVKQLSHDDLKREYAKKLGVVLLEIPYTVDTYEKMKAVLEKYIERS